MAIQPEHRVSAKTKKKQDWYSNAYEYYKGRARELNNKEKDEIFMQAANGIVDQDTYKYVLNPLVAEGDYQNSLPSQVRDVDIISPIRERHLSEYLKSPYQVQVTINNSDIVLERNATLNNQIQQLYEDYIVQYMNEQGMNTGVDVSVPENMPDTIQKYTEDLLDDRAIQGQHILNIINDENDFDMQRLSLFFDWWATEQFYTYRYIENGEFYRTRIPVLEAYPIDNGEEFVEDMEGFLWERPISYEEAKTKYRNKLKGADRDIFDRFENNSYHNGELAARYSELKHLDNRFNGVSSTDPNQYMYFTREGEITEKIFIFKTEVKRYILSYDNGKGELLERIVEENYQLNPEAGDVEINQDWIEEVWTGTELGTDDVYVQTPPEPILLQRYDSRFRCKLPVGGKRGIINGLLLNPIPYRLLSYLALYRIYTNKQERLVAKYRGSITAIPKSMLKGEEIDPAQQYFYLKEDGTIIYDDEEISPSNVASGFRVLGDSGLEQMLVTLNELRREIKMEAWELANMNKERMGDVNPRQGKGVTEQAIYRARMASNLMENVFNKALEKDHIADLQWSKVAYIDGKTGYYRDDTDKPVFYNIDGVRHLETEYGLFVKNSEVEADKLQAYKEMAFAASQNGDFDLASTAISSTNSIEIKRSIDRYMEAKRQFEATAAERESQLVEQGKQADHQRELEKIQVESELETQKEVLLKSLDSDDSSVRQQALAEAKLSLDERKQSTDEYNAEQDRQLKREEMKSAETIAKVNKN